jgi:hypothetical protein
MTNRARRRSLTERGWARDGGPSDAASRALEREVFERVFGYRAAPGVKVPRFTEAHEMAEAVISHIREAWHPQEFRAWRRRVTHGGAGFGAGMPGITPQHAIGC